MTLHVQVHALCTGTPQPFKDDETSAIDKRPVDGPVAIRRLGLAGDEQADRKHHGGPDMAVHHYPRDHYPGWAEWLGGHDLLMLDAAFGENIVAEGLVESDVHIGDRFRLGTALLEISQPRQPCWKIEHRFGRKGMVKRIIGQHNCGWYYRVIEDGTAQAGDRLERVATGHARWSVARLFAALYDPAHEASAEELHEIAGLEQLSSQWRQKAAEAAGRD